ncbi:lipopolysaccharide biosynthesis protein [Anaeromyxobacter sp. SG17]|uniref:lipopolysaccharide biosynthesis protein n=1 Tax=Anaeromyxobacter sp. SG17 TaxID=2925405 RepID=UPI001F58870B|nr:oligosaccharide flippase family protein [Anaeromyxobacter sp. SG17]
MSRETRDLPIGRRWVDLTLGRAEPSGDRQRRHVRIVQAAVSALAVRGISIIAGLVTVPLTVRYLGAERYGAWMTLSACLAWMQIADLGVGNGLTNAVAEAYGRGRDEEARSHVSTAFFTLAGLAAAILAVATVAWPWVSWSAVFNVTSPVAKAEIGAAVAIAAVLYIVAFPFSIAERVYAARQEGALANGWSAAANVASLIAIVFVTRTDGGLVSLVLAVSGVQTAAALISAGWLFWTRPALRPRIHTVRRTSFARLWRDGGRFFAIQIIGIVLFGTDNIIIAHVLGADQVTPYSVTWRLFAVGTMIVGLYLPYLWPAYAEALAKRDGEWIARTLRTSVVVSAAAAAAFAVPLALFGRPIIAAWAGAAAVPSTALLGWMAAWSLVSAPANAVACMLNGIGQLTGQIYYGIAAAVANVVLSIVLARHFGIAGVIAATVVSYLTCAAVPAALEAARALRRIACEVIER